MDFFHFAVNIWAALGMGVLIGIERQFGHHPAGLRTNALVCVGAALFVSLSRLAGPGDVPTRIAAQVVSGIGLLGGGVILREGFNVRGMNTAATLWCSGAVGVLAGAGLPLHALFGTMTILMLHLALRPLAERIDARVKAAVDVETHYRVKVVCGATQEAVIRTILMRHVSSDARMTIQRIATREGDRPDRAAVVVDVASTERADRTMQDLISRVNIEPGVTSASFEKLSGMEP